MKITKKKLIVIMFIFIICIFFMNYVQSAWLVNPSEYEPPSLTSASGVSKLETMANKIIGVVQIIGSVGSVLGLIIIGIKYMMGSVEEKAEYKKTLKPYLIGAILVFGITNILAVIQSIISSV